MRDFLRELVCPRMWLELFAAGAFVCAAPVIALLIVEALS